MLQTSTRTSTTAADVFDLLSVGAATLFTAIRKHRKAARARETLSGLTDAQLADAGIDRWSIHHPRPTLEVERGLMTKLMAMR
jgi:hypothetical protein